MNNKSNGRWGLLGDRDFRLLWGSFTITTFGAQVTNIALPLAAALLLGASPLQMGILIALEALPFALFSLPAGVWIDRTRKLPLILWTDWIRAVVLLAIPIAALGGVLSIALLYAVGFACGALNVVGGAAAQVYLTQLVGRERLIDAHSKIATSNSAAEMVGPGLAGLLVQAFSAPMAIMVDALAFFVSGWMLRGIRASDDGVAVAGETRMWPEIVAGLRLVWENRVLRALAWVVALWIFVEHAYFAAVILFAVRELGLSPGAIGVAYALSGVGCLCAALASPRLTRLLGIGSVTVAGLLMTGVAWQWIALVPGHSPGSMPALGAGMFGFGFGATLFGINYLSLRQAITPDALLGRMTATMRFLTVAAAPLGSLAGGLAGEWLGLRVTLGLVGIGGIVLGLVAILATPVRTVRTLPPIGG